MLYGVFTSAVVEGILQEKDFSTIGTGFLVLAACTDREPEYWKEPVRTRVGNTYFDIVNTLQYGSTMLEKSSAPGFPLFYKLKIQPRTEKELFGTLDDMNLVTLKCFTLHHIAVDLQRFEDVRRLSSKWLNFS